MTERGLPIADAAPACPFVAFDDQRDDRSDRPDPRHRCYAESPPSPRARAHQEAYCLSANFPVCPTFQDWARREAARVLPTAGAGTPAERLRDVPAQRVAGERPPAFGGARAASDWPGSRAPADHGAAATPAPSDAFLERIIEREGTDDDDGADAPAPPRDPWDLPARRTVPPEWSAPPPWAARGPSTADEGEPDGDDVDAPPFLRETADRPSRDEGVWSRPGDDDDDEAGSAGAATAAGPPGRDATMARLRAMGMGGDAAGPQDDESDAPAPRPVPHAARIGTADDDPRYARTAPPSGMAAGRGMSDRAGASAAGGAAAAGARDVIDAAPTAEPPARSSGGLARILGWDRRPRAGSTRPARQPQKEPSWERPRRYEAYPTLKTRVGVPMPGRLWLAAGAVLVAALILFFVPPMFLNQRGGTGGPGATRTPAASGAGASGAVSSPGRSVGPTAKPTPKQQTYTIKQGDTLSSIAKRFKITVEELLAANKQIKDPNKIAIGDVLVIPSPAPSEVVDGGASP